MTQLEEQNYLVDYAWSIKEVNHMDLVDGHSQVIRLQHVFYDRLQLLLNDQLPVSLYNTYDPINKKLIDDYNSQPDKHNTAMTCRIIWYHNQEPILDATSLRVVEVLAMEDISIDNILYQDLKRSLAFSGIHMSPDTLISTNTLFSWLSKEFYSWNISVTEIQKFRKLFFRKIQHIT